MRHGSLFSGIGGFDLAAEWMGWENTFNCEWEEFPRKVLAYHFPNAKSYGDIKETDFTIWRGQIDILSGGFPCQPFSQAGKRQGTEDDRYLWPEMLRAIREISPRWIVGENVRGLVNWSGGMVFDQVCADLEGEGYKVFPVLIPAAAVNAPHRRDRIWFVAHFDSGRGCGQARVGENDLLGGEGEKQDDHAFPTNQGLESGERDVSGSAPYSDGSEQTNRSGENREAQGEIRGNEKRHVLGELLGDGDAADTKSTRSKGQRIKRQGEVQSDRRGKQDAQYTWQFFPTQSPICGGNDGIPRELDSITFPKWRNESIKAYGNAIVPQVAHEIFKTIERYEILAHHHNTRQTDHDHRRANLRADEPQT